MSYDVLVMGPLFCDVIFTELPGMPVLGQEIYADRLNITPGGSAILAAGLHKLGLKVGLIADLGNDPISALLRAMLDEMGLDRTLIREHPHPLPQLTVALSFPEDRAFVTRYVKSSEPLALRQLLAAHPAQHLHLYGTAPAADHPDICEVAHEAGLTISLDPGWSEEGLRDARVHRVVRGLDLFLPSENELCYMADADDLDVALAHVQARMPKGLIVVKRGALGALAFGDGVREPLAALPVDVVDTTGAGDSFDAGYLCGYLRGEPIRRCLQMGAVCGALSTTKVGGATAAPTLEEMQTWLSKLPS